MKRNLTVALAWSAALLATTACMDNYEELPVDQYTEDFLFSSTDSVGDRALGFLGTIYDALESGHSRVGGYYLDAASDDALPVDMDGEPDVLKLQLGQYTARTRITSEMKWGDYYSLIRKVNIFINGIDVVPFKDTYMNALGEQQPFNRTLKAEARFIRAWFYFQMLERYGGVPLMGDKVFDINDNLELPRNTFAECVDYIVSELDAIQDSLRAIPMDLPGLYAHVPTKQACVALKARVLLYAASPLFNERPIAPGNELIGYAAYDRNRWKKAADAAREFMETWGDKGDGTFKLATSVRNIFLNFYHKSLNPELIFFRQGGSGTGVESNLGPLGFSGTNIGSGRTNPTQNLVDAFPMKDGKAIGEEGKYTYDPQNPYANRDPRLDLTVLHNGSKWLGTTLQTWQGGAHNPNSGEDYSTTSYFQRKFMGSFESQSSYSAVLHLWIIMRYTEVVLNFAEAENEVLDVPSQEVYDVLLALRKRAGIEAGSDNMYGLKASMTKEEMRQAIRNERRLELAFEEHRYFDIRRWREAENIYRQPLKGMQIASNGVGVTYTSSDVLNVAWDNKRYFYPIPYTEVNKNDNMVQNPNW